MSTREAPGSAVITPSTVRAAHPHRSGELLVPLRVVSHFRGGLPQFERPLPGPVETCPPEVAGGHGVAGSLMGFEATRSGDPPAVRRGSGR